ncbi:MAG: glutaminase A [Thermomicrobiales bacterium]
MSREVNPGFVSTGSLPSPERVRDLLHTAWTTISSDAEGTVSQVYPALARVSPDLFGLCLVGTGGEAHAMGDADVPFSIMSVSKPFVLALVCEAIGPDAVRAQLGVNATGMAFNSAAAIERSADGRTNPMVNAGAIATTSLVPGADAEARWQHIAQGLARFAGRDLAVNAEIYASASATNVQNRGLTMLLQARGRLGSDPVEALDLYTRQCALEITARDLAVMGATLADGGVNPLTGEQVIAAETCHYVLAVMATAGMYETSGDWLYEVGLPAKSGIGGGIVTVSPGKGALATFSPPLDAAGNSVRGQLAARFLSHQLGLDLFVSRPK